MITSGLGYTSRRLGILSRLNELGSLLIAYRRGPESRVRHAIAEVSAALDEISALRGSPAAGLDMLEIGSGQQSIQLAAMSRNNRAIGIDSESTGDEITLGTILRTIRSDGIIRAAKTVARKALGFDRAMRNEFLKQTGAAMWPRLNILQMDAEKLTFPDNSFDVVISRAVFEHISSPRNVIREVARVLRPGGVFYCLLHLYTSDSGCHDIRIFANRRHDIPLWSHLRESHRQKVIENTYLNRIRLSEWQEIFESTLPGVRVSALMDDAGIDRRSQLATIRANAELTDYSDVELLTVTVKALWQRQAITDSSQLSNLPIRHVTPSEPPAAEGTSISR